MTDELPEQSNADPDEMAEDEFDESYDPDTETPGAEDEESAGPPGPVNWNLLTADAAEEEWLALNEWVHWLRHTYGLPVAVVPPFWHRHPEHVWELSALHIHWLCAIHHEAKGSAMLVWHRDFAEARERLRDWTSACGTRLNTDRATRQIVWPGEKPVEPVEDVVVPNREEDFVEYMHADVEARRRAEDQFIAGLVLSTGEVP